MRLPIDTTTIKFAAAGAAEPVLDFATKSQKTDEHGVPLFQVPVFAAGGGIGRTPKTKPLTLRVVAGS